MRHPARDHTEVFQRPAAPPVQMPACWIQTSQDAGLLHSQAAQSHAGGRERPVLKGGMGPDSLRPLRGLTTLIRWKPGQRYQNTRLLSSVSSSWWARE